MPHATAPTSETITPALRNLLDRQLAPGERIAWLGRPSAVRLLVMHGCSILLLGIPLCALGAFTLWIFSTGSSSPRTGPVAGRFVTMWSAAFVGVVLLVASSPLWSWWQELHTAYAVTDRRALILTTTGGGVTVQSFTGEQLAGAVLREGPDGWGDLVFERVRVGRGRKYVMRDVGFLRIPAVAQVQRLLPAALKPVEP
jgi:hypothetical protein